MVISLLDGCGLSKTVQCAHLAKTTKFMLC